MKKKTILIASLILVLALGLAGTLAFFTATDTATNKISLGNVKIQLIETTLVDSEEVPFPTDPVPAMPGDHISKRVRVKNTGDNPIWLRVKLTPSLTPAVAGWEGLITMDTDSTNWEKSGDWYYYKTQLSPGAVTQNLITVVRFHASLGNAYQDAAFQLVALAEAVQSQNNGSSASTAIGWPTP